MNTEKMTEFMKERKLKPEDMAKAAEIDISTWYRKMQKNGDTLNIKEMNLIISAFEIPTSRAASIFFDESLA